MLQFPFQRFSANSNHGNQSLGKLPEWNLDDLYTGEDAHELKQDLNWLETSCLNFANDFENKLATLSAIELLLCVQQQERINQVAGRIMSFAGLRYYQMTTDAGRTKFMSDMQDKDRLCVSASVLQPFQLEQLPEP
jgi:oligoendopeptidase F